MSVILSTLNSKYIHTNLAIRYLKANAKDFDITLKEYTLKDSLDNILNNLLSMRPKIIGFSVYIWNVEKTLQLINLLKEKDPTLTIIMGGPEVSYDFDVWFSRSSVDYIIYGEGELSFKELMEYLHGRRDLADVRGIVYRNLLTKELVQNPPAPILDPKEIHLFILKRISLCFQHESNISKPLADAHILVNTVLHLWIIKFVTSISKK